MGICVVLYSSCGALMGLATEYWHLVVLRMGIGAGLGWDAFRSLHSYSARLLFSLFVAHREAAVRPCAASLIAELFDPSTRGVANGIFSWGVYIGYGLAFVFGDYVAKADGLGYEWRAACVLACAWGGLVGVVLFLHEDPRTSRKK